MRLAPFAAALCFSLSLFAAPSAEAKRHRAPAHHSAAPAGGAVVTSVITRGPNGVVLTATIRNGMTVPLCAAPTYGAGARITATRRGRALRNLEIRGMPPLTQQERQASCLRLDPNGATRVTYRLDRMFREPLAGARVCYSFPYRRIDQQTALQSSGCATG